jgi:hypothetical protein
MVTTIQLKLLSLSFLQLPLFMIVSPTPVVHNYRTTLPVSTAPVSVAPGTYNSTKVVTDTSPTTFHNKITTLPVSTTVDGHYYSAEAVVTVISPTAVVHDRFSNSRCS